MTATTAWREMDRRQANGLDVRLIWLPDTNEVVVSVDDAKTHMGFDVLVEPGHEQEAFQHPYAYATKRGERMERRET